MQNEKANDIPARSIEIHYYMSKYALKRSNFPIARILYKGSSKSIPSNLLKELTSAELKLLYTPKFVRIYKFVIICSVV